MIIGPDAMSIIENLLVEHLENLMFLCVDLAAYSNHEMKCHRSSKRLSYHHGRCKNLSTRVFSAC